MPRASIRPEPVVRQLIVLASALCLVLGACRPASPDADDEGSGAPPATGGSGDEAPAPTEADAETAPSGATDDGTPADDGPAGATAGTASPDGTPEDPSDDGERVEGTGDEGASEGNGADPTTDAAPDAADLTAPLMRMPPGASMAFAIDLEVLNAWTADVVRVSSDGGLDAAMGGLLARAVGAPALAERIRVPAEGVLTLGAWGDDGDDVSWFAPAGALTTPPADGGAAASVAGDVRAARRGDAIAVGRGFGVTAFAGGAAGGLDTAEVAGAADALPTNGAAMVGWWSAAQVDAALPGIGAAVDGAALAVDPDGSVRIALATGDPDTVLRALGRGQAWTSMALGQWRREASTDFSAAVAIVARQVDLAWSRLSVTPHEGHVELRLAAPTCGGPMRNLPVAMALLGVTEAAAHDDAAPSIAFAATTVETAGCDAVQGPAPTVPTALARLAPSEAVPGLVVLADVGAIARHISPDAGGLLPARIDIDVLDAAVGGRPFGLDGWQDDAAHVGAWIEAAEGAPERALVLPRGIADLDAVQQAGPGARIGEMVLNAVVPGGLLFATRGTPAATRLDASDASPWVDAAARLPDDTLAAVLIPASLIDPWLARLPAGDGAAVEAAARASGILAIAWTASRGPMLVLGPGVDGASVRAALPSALATGIAAIGRYGVMPPDARTALGERLGHLASGLTIDATDDRTALVFEGGGAAFVATALTVALPAIGGALENPGFDLPQVTPQLIYDAARPTTP